MSGKREIGIVLVVDMVASTSMRQDIGESRFGEVKRQLDAICRRIVTNLAGRVVKEQGDGLMAVFATATEALAAGVGILRSTANANRRLAPREQVQLRVGVSAGEIAWEDGEITGMVPVEAARLETAASPGGLLCSDLVRLLVGGADAHTFVPVDALRLKGLRDPVMAWRVVWEESSSSQDIGLPEALETVTRLSFVGRVAELDVLAGVWNEAAAGRGRMVTIAGEPGIGKTRLCSELARRCHQQGGIVLYGRSDQVVAHPFQPFVEAFTRYVRRTSHLELLPLNVAAELSRLVPQLRERSPGIAKPQEADSDTQRYLLFEAMVAWLDMLADEDPVLLILDDVTWSSEPTLAMLCHLAYSLPTKHLLCVLTYRPQEASDRLRDVLADLRRRIGVDAVTLNGLEQNDVIAALHGLFDNVPLHPSVVALASAIWRASGGNPFFVGELFADLLASGSIHRAEREWTTTTSPSELTIPALVSDVVRQRARALAPRARSVLEVAAVAGLAFDAQTLRTALELDPRVCAEALEEAEASGLVRISLEGDRPQYEFSHALVRDVLYNGISPYRRGLTHQSVARALESVHPETLDDHADELAVHYSLGVDADDAARAVWYSDLAAQRAARRLAHVEAVVHYQRALETLTRARLPDEPHLRCRLQVELGGAMRRAGDPQATATLLHASHSAARLGDGPLCARAVLTGTFGRFSTASVIDYDRIDALQAALDLVGPGDSGTRAFLLANLSIELHFPGNHKEQDRLSDEATAMARRLGDIGALIPVLSLRLVTLWRANRMAERLALATELEELCERVGRARLTLMAATMGCQVAMEAGDVVTADRRAAIIDQVSEALHQPLTLGFARLRQSMRAVIHGHLEEGERLAREAYHLTRAGGHPDADAVWVGQCFSIRLHQGRLDEIAVDLVATADANPRIPAFRAAVALLAAEQGRPVDARVALDAIFGRDGSGVVPDDLNWMTTIALAAHAGATINELPLCAALVEQLKPFRHQFVGNASTFFGAVELYIALASSALGRHDDADEAFRRAIDAHARLAAPILLARSQLEWAAAMMRRGAAADGTDPVQLFEAARSVAEQLDLRPIVTRARRGLQQISAAVPVSPGSLAGSLIDLNAQ